MGRDLNNSCSSDAEDNKWKYHTETQDKKWKSQLFLAVIHRTTAKMVINLLPCSSHAETEDKQLSSTNPCDNRPKAFFGGD